jgi:hypothetical protein
MRTDPAAARRIAVVLAGFAAAAPPGIDGGRFAAASLADTYELVHALVGVDAAIAGETSVEGLLWPGSRRFPPFVELAELAAACAGYDQLVVVPADAPDLPGLVVAKIFRALQRAEVCVAPERGRAGCVALGVRLPVAPWVDLGLDLDRDLGPDLLRDAPRPNLVALAPDWHRLRSPADVHRLDPGLEGWEETRALLAGRRLEA